MPYSPNGKGRLARPVGEQSHRSDTDCISALRDAVKLHKSALEVSGAAANLAKAVPETGAAGLNKRSPSAPHR